MRKVFVLSLFLFVSFSVFAGAFYLDAGLGFQYSEGKLAFESSYPSPIQDIKYKTNQFNFLLGFSYENDKHLVVYDNLSFSPSRNLKFIYEGYGETENINPDSMYVITENVGIGRAFNKNSLRFVTGIGLHFDFTNAEIKSEIETSTFEMTNIGFNLHLQSSYQFSERIAATVILSPNFNIYNSVTITNNGNSSDNKSGISFTAIVGMSFKIGTQEKKHSGAKTDTTENVTTINTGRHYIGSKLNSRVTRMK